MSESLKNKIVVRVESMVRNQVVDKTWVYWSDLKFPRPKYKVWDQIRIQVGDQVGNQVYLQVRKLTEEACLGL